MSNLLFITEAYPNTRGDAAFIENEIKHVTRKFDKVIVMSHGNPSGPCAALPANAEVIYIKRKRLPAKLMLCIPAFFSSEFWKELGVIVRTHKNIASIKELLYFLVMSLSESKLVLSVLNKCEIGLAYTYWYSCSTLACLMARRKSGMKNMAVCTRSHGYDLYEAQNLYMYQAFKSRMDREINRVFFISRNGLEYYRAHFATRESNVYRLCYLGTGNATGFIPHDYTDTIRVLSVSNVVPVKRIHLIIRALAECAKRGIRICWTHIGDGPEMGDVRSLAGQTLGGQGLVSFRLLGYMTNQEVHDYYAGNDVDLFVNASESEGLPVSMMEAMSYGVPVAAPGVGGIGEIVDSDTGWLLEKDRCAEGLAGAIESWGNMQREERNAMALNAHRKWDSLFNAERNYQEFAEELYEAASV